VNKGPAPLFGHDTRAVLGELGYEPERVEMLIAEGSCIAASPQS
jgi:hypothetical protein